MVVLLMNKKKVYPFYFVLGALILYSLLYVLPSFIGIGYSLTDWTAFTNKVHFVGLENYKKLGASTEHYIRYIGNTLLFTVVTTACKTVLGLAFAVLLTKRVIMPNLHRAIIFLPAVLSMLVVGLIFRSILNPEIGLLNTFLRAVGLDALAKGWLVDPKTAFASVMAVDIWKGTGYIMTIMIAGLMAISPTYYEAAEIDGARSWQQFRHITLPLLMPTLTTTTVLNVIYGLRIFDMVYVLTNGGPGYRTEVVYTSVFKEFSKGNYAMGTTLSSVLFVFMVIVGVGLIKMMMRNEVQE